MAFRVSLSGPAETDAYEAYEHVRSVAPMKAEGWLVKLFQAILSLDEMPTRCAVIPEAEELGFTVRHLLHGRGRGTYRIIFSLDENEPHVKVLRIWHAFREAITANDVRD